ncbi:MAG: LysR family transcriptional regulator [Devosia sp.]|nr:LysR family transcriptional regulator [Devosia sp.]
MPTANAKVHNSAMIDWDDLRHFLAVAREGSTLAAARTLGVNQSTVQRRLTALERQLGRALAHRHPTGYRLTEFGEMLLPYARSVEDAVFSLERRAEGFGGNVAGTVRLTCPEPVMPRLIASGILDRFHARYPAVRVEFATADRYLDLWRGEADVALRSGEPEDPRLVGRKVADSIWAVYGSRDYVQRHGRPASVEQLADYALVGFDGSMTGHRANKWLSTVAPGATIAARNSSVLGVLSAVKSGIGLAPLPTTIAGPEDTLIQVLPPVPELNRGWYLLTHPELRQESRIAAFFDFVVGELPALRTVLMG